MHAKHETAQTQPGCWWRAAFELMPAKPVAAVRRPSRLKSNISRTPSRRPSRLKSNISRTPSGCRSKSATLLSNFDDSSILLRGVAFSENLPPPSRLKSNISRTPSGCRSQRGTYLNNFDDSSILLRGIAFSENFEKCEDFWKVTFWAPICVVCCLLSVEPSQTRKAGFAGNHLIEKYQKQIKTSWQNQNAIDFGKVTEILVCVTFFY